MAKKRIEKLDGAFPDFLDEEQSSLDQIFDIISLSFQPKAPTSPILSQDALEAVDNLYENKISKIREDILSLEQNAATFIQADIENLYKGSFVRDYAKHLQISEKAAKEQLRKELVEKLKALGMDCIDKRYYSLPREIKHIIRMDFYGTIDKIDEKNDGKSTKHLSLVYLNRDLQKTKDVKIQDYNLAASPIWMIYRQFRSFRLLERNLSKLLKDAGISPDEFVHLNAYDISQILYNHYINKSKPDADKSERANLFLGAKYRFVKTFIRHNKEAFAHIMNLRGIDPRYTEALIKHMEQYGITSDFDVVEKEYSAETLEILKKHKLIPEDTKAGDPIKDKEISKIKKAGLIGLILARDENGNPITGPEITVHHKIAVQDSGERTNFAEVNQFKNLCIIIEPYHFFAHALDRTQNTNGAECYVSRIEIGENIAFYGGFNKIFQLEYDFGAPHYNEYDAEVLQQVGPKQISDSEIIAYLEAQKKLSRRKKYPRKKKKTHNQENTEKDKLPRKQKKKENLASSLEPSNENKKTPHKNSASQPPKEAMQAAEKTPQNGSNGSNGSKENNTNKTHALSKRIEHLTRKKDEYNKIRAELMEKRKQYLSLRAAKKSAIQTISQFEDDEKFEKFIQYAIRMQNKQK